MSSTVEQANAAMARSKQLEAKGTLQLALDSLLKNTFLEKRRMVVPEAIALKDKLNGNNFLSFEWIKNRQHEIRKLKYAIAFEDVKYLAEFGNTVEIGRYKPLIIRANNPNTWALYDKLLPDGEQFTFEQYATEDVEYETCDLGVCEDESQCQHKVKRVERREIYQTKHSIGNWQCRGCLMAYPDNNSSAVDVAEQRQIAWCPKFLSGLALATKSPDVYVKMIRQSNPDMMLCYAGLMHSEFASYADKLQFRWKCDTCGFGTTDDVLIKANQPTQIMTDEQTKR